MTDITVANLLDNLINASVRGDQKLLRMGKPQEGHIAFEGNTGLLLKQMPKVGFVQLQVIGNLPDGELPGIVVVDILLSLSNFGVLLGYMAEIFRGAAGLGQGEEDLSQKDVQLHLIKLLLCGIDLISPADQLSKLDCGGVPGWDTVLKAERVVLQKAEVLTVHRLTAGGGDDRGQEYEEQKLGVLIAVGGGHVALVIVGDKNVPRANGIYLVQIDKFP